MSHLANDEEADVDEHQSARARLLINNDRSNDQSSGYQPFTIPHNSSSTRLSQINQSTPSPYSSGKWTVAFLAMFSTICTLTGLLLLDPHLLSSLMSHSVSHTVERSNIEPSFVAISHVPQLMSVHIPPPCHATIEETLARIQANQQLNNQSIDREVLSPMDPQITYLLLGCAMEQVRSPPGSCLGHHSLQESLLMMGMIVSLSTNQLINQPIQYIAGTFFNQHTDWDQFVGINDGETHLIDVTIDARTPMQSIDHLSVNQTIEQIIDRSKASGSSVIYHINEFEQKIILDQFAQSDQSVMSVVSSVLAIKYCYARSLRPQLIDLYVNDRFDRLVDRSMNQAVFKDFVPQQVTYDPRFAPTIIAVALNNTDTQLIDQSVHSIYQTVTLLTNQQPSIQSVSVHVFFEYVDGPVDEQVFLNGYQSVNQSNVQSFQPSFHLHMRPATSRMHHFISADVLIGDDQPMSLYAAFARYQRLTILPVYAPLESVVVFNTSIHQIIEPTPFTRSLALTHIINPHKYRTKRECHDMLNEYELAKMHAIDTTQ